MSSSDDMAPAGEPDPYAERAAERRFPSRLPAPGSGGGSEWGEMVQLYSTEVRPFPAPADHPAGVPPVVASGPGSRVGWLLRGRRGECDGGAAACS